MTRKSLITAAAWLARHELALLLLSSPLMLFPSRFSLIPLVMIPILWLCRWIVWGRLMRRSSLDWSILALLVLVLISLSVSFDPKTSLPRLLGLILGVGIFYAMTSDLYTGKRFSRLIVTTLGLGILISVVALLGMEGVEKMPLVGELQVRLAGSLGLPAELGRSFNPNEVGGTLAMLMPFALAVLVFPAGRKIKALAATSLVAMLITAALAQSRWAFVAFVTAGILVLAVKDRRFWLTVPSLTVLSLGLVTITGFDKVLASFSPVAGADSVVGRLEIWQRGLYILQDFPFTGTGLNAFVPASQRLYPYFTVPDVNLGHAHNLFLQIGVDLGFPGLIVVLVFFASLLLLWKSGRRFIRGSEYEGAYVGFLGLITAYLVFGLVDAIAFGAKPSALVWFAAGGIIGLRQSFVPDQSSSVSGPTWKRHLERVAGDRWKLFIPGVAVAIIGAVGLAGILSAEAFDRNLGNVLISKGALLGDRQMLDSGEALLNRAVQWNPRDGLAFRSLGKVALVRGEFSSAVTALEKGLKLRANEPIDYFYLGYAYEKAGRAAQAVDAWQKAGAQGYFVRVGWAHNLSGEFAEAQQYFDIALAIDPRSSEVWHGLGFAHLQEGQIEEAVADLSKAEQLDSNNLDIRLALGDAYRDQRSYREADRWYALALAIEPHNPAAHLKRGINYFGMSQWDPAVSELRAALAADSPFPDVYLAHLYLARAYARQSRLAEAAGEYEQALSLHPESDFRVELGQIYVRLGRYAEARREFEAALVLSPQDPGAHRELEKLNASPNI